MTITTITQSEITGIKPTDVPKEGIFIIKMEGKYYVYRGNFETEELSDIIVCDFFYEVLEMMKTKAMFDFFKEIEDA